jgi:intracellular septation protein A
MADVFKKLAVDFFATIIFLLVYAATGNVLIATGVAIAGAIAQLVYAKASGKPLSYMTYASLALVILLGGLTLLTNDPRFVLAKPSIAHFAIGAIMLKRGWLERYMPQIVRDNAPDLIVAAGYGWAALMGVLGLGVIAVAMTGDMKLWALYVSVIAVGAKVIAGAITYGVLRLVIGRRLRQQAMA